MTQPSTFQTFGTSHLVTLGACVAVLVTLGILRRLKVGAAIWLERTLGTVLFTLWPLATLAHWRAGTLDWENGLPLHFCDLAGIAGGLALWTRKQLPCEIVYFFGLAGTLQGLLTPNLEVDFPDGRFLVFFLLHGGVVVTALHVVTAMKHAPRPGAVWRMMALTLGYAVLVTPFNLALGTNFGFLVKKPARDSLMNHLGAWPWYIGSLILLALVFYTILYLPFLIRRRFRPQSS
ncbi:MAG TPA: TIGR02206 family membrane protein [Prosthecobacter sp.]|nr:TIGR02206 family membrane protein [Prosthecobacter sp.]